MLAAENVRTLSHEVHAAKDNIATLGLGSLEGELEGVTAEIGELDDFVALIMMAQNDDVRTQTSLGGGDTVVEGGVRHEKVRVEVAAYAGFDFRRAKSRRLVCADEGAAIRNGY
jgi:hypothetical protein